MTNVGIDASLLNGNLDFSFEFFDKRTSDILRKGYFAGSSRWSGWADP